MSRTALKYKFILITAAVLVLGGVGWVVNNQEQSSNASSTVLQTESVKTPLTQLEYQGEGGKTALAILKSKYTVITKQYSFGELVTSIDGSEGNGPKYWTFYINGQESQVGAGDYTTKAADQLEWKLQ